MEGYENVGKIVRILEHLKNGNIRALVEIPCSRCGNEKYFKHLSHIEGGRCFKCNGEGIEQKTVIVMTLENREKSNRKKQLKYEAEVAKRLERQQELEKEQEVIIAKQESQLEANKRFPRKYIEIFKMIDKTNVYELNFSRNLVDTMKHKPLNEISEREKEYIGDFLARKLHRRNSKKYQELYEQILNDLNEDYSC